MFISGHEGNKSLEFYEHPSLETVAERSRHMGLPAGTAAAIGASLLAPRPGQSVIDSVHEMRVPGGETLYDREVRLKRLKSPVPA